MTTSTTSADTLPPPVRMIHLIGGYQISQAVHVAATLGIADLVADGVTTSEALGAATGAVPGRLHRVLRTLAAYDVFVETRPRTWGLTPLAETLRRDVPGSVRNLVLTWGAEHYRAFGELVAAVRSDRPAFDIAYGTDFWSHLAEHPDSAATFGAAMGDVSGQVHAAAVGAYDFSGLRHVVDVGGGQGFLLALLLGRHPRLRATLLELPHVLPGAEKTLAEAGVLDRCTLVAGDFRDHVPAGGDAYLLSLVVHDWDDETCVRILGNVRRVGGPDARLLIVDTVLPDGAEPHLGRMIDLTMLAMLTGQERTRAEFAALLDAAGFELRRVVPTGAHTSVLEACPA
ncbi:MAG: methyltransferase [Pseudonocardia sp.]